MKNTKNEIVNMLDELTDYQLEYLFNLIRLLLGKTTD